MLTLNEQYTPQSSSQPSSHSAHLSAPNHDIIDHAHLARYTLGDGALEHEILGLFAGQIPSLIAQLVQARTTNDQALWYETAHALKGSASAVGARHVARLAAQAEQVGVALTNVEFDELKNAVHGALDYIGKL